MYIGSNRSMKRPRESWPDARAGLICERICGMPFSREISIATFICGLPSARVIFSRAKRSNAPRLTLRDDHANGGASKLRDARRHASGAGLGAATAASPSREKFYLRYHNAMARGPNTNGEI